MASNRIPLIDEFYQDASYGVMKFRGYKEGKYVYELFERSPFDQGPASGWLKSGNNVNIDPEFQHRRAALGKVRYRVPPQ